MNVLFLCGLYPLEYKQQVLDNSKKGYQFAAQNFQESLIDGFVKNGVELSVVSSPFLSTYPLGYKHFLINYKETMVGDLVKVRKIKILNLPFLNRIFNNAEKEAMDWCESNFMKGDLRVIIYSLKADLINIGIKLKQKFHNIKLSIIILDLPENMSVNSFYKILGLKKRDTDFIYKSLSNFDNFVLLTDAMASKLSLKKDSYCVVEGLYSDKNTSVFNRKPDSELKTILYSGALVAKYGLELLLKAFLFLDNKNYRLLILGDGEAKGLVEQYCLKDSRITFKGKVSHEVSLKLQLQSDLLVNPRTNQGEYTKYSFPSKTMEYLASGTPVLMYKLRGVPDKYFDYCFVIEEDDGYKGLATKIQNILSLPIIERNSLGSRAREFILREKNSKVQVRKILELIS